MFDVIVSLIVSFIVSLVLLKRSSSWLTFLIAIAVGALIGWQVLNVFPAEQTSLSYLLSTNPELKIIWDQTHDIFEVARAARYGQYILIGFNVVGAAVGYFLAKTFSKHV